jgi:hypothetical protein
VKVEFRTAEAKYENLPTLAVGLVQLQPNVIVVTNASVVEKTDAGVASAFLLL